MDPWTIKYDGITEEDVRRTLQSVTPRPLEVRPLTVEGRDDRGRFYTEDCETGIRVTDELYGGASVGVGSRLDLSVDEIRSAMLRLGATTDDSGHYFVRGRSVGSVSRIGFPAPPAAKSTNRWHRRGKRGRRGKTGYRTR